MHEYQIQGSGSIEILDLGFSTSFFIIEMGILHAETL